MSTVSFQHVINIKVINELFLTNEVFDSIFHIKCTNSSVMFYT